MKPFTLSAYSVTLLIATLDLSFAAASPNAESPAYRADGYPTAEYGFGSPSQLEFEAKVNAGEIQLDAPSYEWGDYVYEFPTPANHGPHDRRDVSPESLSPTTTASGSSVTATATPVVERRPDARIVFIAFAPTGKKGPNGEAVYAPVSSARVKEDPTDVRFYPYIALLTNGKETLVRAPPTIGAAYRPIFPSGFLPSSRPLIQKTETATNIIFATFLTKSAGSQITSATNVPLTTLITKPASSQITSPRYTQTA